MCFPASRHFAGRRCFCIGHVGIVIGRHQCSRRGRRCGEAEVVENEKRAFSITAFCERYGIGRTSAYEEIAAGRLQVVKAGKRTLVPADAAESWLRSLPAVEPKTLVARHAPAESTN